MEPLTLDGLPDRALLLIDSAPIIYYLEGHRTFGPRFAPLFEAHQQGRVLLAISAITVAEVLIGPIRAGDDALALRYRAILDTWRVVALDGDIVESAARLRVSLGLKLPDAIQLASALAINAAALVTADRDFSRVRALRVIGGQVSSGMPNRS